LVEDGAGLGPCIVPRRQLTKAEGDYDLFLTKRTQLVSRERNLRIRLGKFYRICMVKRTVVHRGKKLGMHPVPRIIHSDHSLCHFKY
jgi:hypothetical protein